MQEVWRPVVGWELRYEVSSQGRVRSLDFVSPNPRGSGTHIREGRQLLLKADANGYVRVGLRDKERRESRLVHHLVAEAFMPPCPGEWGRGKGCWQIDHRNEIKTDNAVGNLRWLPGDINRRRSASSLTAAIVQEIRKKRKQGETGRDLAKLYGLSEGAVSLICSRKTWGWVED
jgi:hypothetical protein